MHTNIAKLRLNFPNVENHRNHQFIIVDVEPEVNAIVALCAIAVELQQHETRLWLKKRDAWYSAPLTQNPRLEEENTRWKECSATSRAVQSDLECH